MGGKFSVGWEDREYMCGHEHTLSFMDSEHLYQGQGPSIKAMQVPCITHLSQP